MQKAYLRVEAIESLEVKKLERISRPATGQPRQTKILSISANDVTAQQQRLSAIAYDLQTRSAFPKIFERDYELNITRLHSMADNL